jgi:hypothetical protein
MFNLAKFTLQSNITQPSPCLQTSRKKISRENALAYFAAASETTTKLYFIFTCWTKYWTMSSRPSKQAARSGVDLALVVPLTLAPALTKALTISEWP